MGFIQKKLTESGVRKFEHLFCALGVFVCGLDCAPKTKQLKLDTEIQTEPANTFRYGSAFHKILIVCIGCKVLS